MPDLKFDVGVKEFTLNDNVTVRFNPTDMAFIERLYDTFTGLDEEQDALKKRINESNDYVGIFDAAREIDSNMRSKINSLFDTDICTPLVGDINIYALADGFPIWANLLLALMDVVDAGYTDNAKARNPRVEKYTKKYKK